ncbi:MAG TPA: aldehyde dehydrogenase (NADP(+)) [Acidobacteriota bacterium]
MDLHGKNIIGKEVSARATEGFRAYAPSLGEKLDPLFYEATESEVDQALQAAHQAFLEYRKGTADDIADLLEKIAGEILALEDTLIQRANAETALPKDRLVSERSRTVNQLRMFAALVKEGSWVDASIDRAIPDRKPVPKPDLRRKLIPIGPVVVFGASNFPLAFSVAGGDTASALAAGNPVVVKAHPAHPGTSELVARAIRRAIESTGAPDGMFSLVHGRSPKVSLRLVSHPLTKAVGFTGSHQAGRSIFDAAASRPDPIPVYAEMGSINPVFILPRALQERRQAFAEGLMQSVTLGVGQFCTCPGLVVGLQDESMSRLISEMGQLIARTPPATMLHPLILESYEEGVRRFGRVVGVTSAQGELAPDPAKTEAQATVFATDATTFLKNRALSEELFGPSTLIVSCPSREEMKEVAQSLKGHLTATVHGTPEDLEEFSSLLPLLENKVGRLIFNGFPTGVEVCPSMHHGGPYPATTDVKFTSVGTAAIKRFARPICYQNFPQEALPVELRNENKRSIWRLVDGQWTKESW